MDIDALIKSTDLSNPDAIESVRQQILNMEKDVDIKLESLLTKQCNIDSKMIGISKALNSLMIVENDSKKIADMINRTSVLAENVSAKVRRLDEARSRVSECQQRVHDLIDLQLCSQGVTTAIREEDFEKGAAHIHRFLSMDQNLLQRTADDVSGSITSVSQAFTTLDSATAQIRLIVTQKFDEAVKKDDLASVERFFKIFPLLGMHKEGIEKFSNYICSKLQIKSQKELRNSMDIAKAEKRTAIAFADTLTLLFEDIARVIEVNQPIIENYYGNGKLIEMFVILQRQCDQDVKRLIQEFYKNRQIQRRCQQISDVIKSSAGQLSGSVTTTQTVMGHFRKSSGSIDKLNPKDIDSLIGEITVMHSRAELYIKFVKRRILNDLDAIEEETKTNHMKQVEEIISKSDLNRQMQELLGTYLLFERYFMEESVLKAISLDTLEQGQQCSSMVDDVFFIIRKSIRRSIKTQSPDGICAVINNAATCFESDFIAALKAPLKVGYPSGYIDLAQAYNAFQTSIQQGKIQTNDSEQARNIFIAQLNNADMSTEYIETLCKTMTEEISIALPGMSQKEHEIMDSCLSGLRSVRLGLKAVVDFGMQQLRSSAIKPRLQTWIDQFLSHNHEFNEIELANYEAGETFVQSLILQLDGLLNTFKSVLSIRNYDTLVSILAADVTARLEHAIKKSKFNRLGGLSLDQDIRKLCSYLTGSTTWSIRDKMVRLTQIATLLNLETLSELSDYWNPEQESTVWRISTAEIRTILALRVDFRMEDIKRLKI